MEERLTEEQRETYNYYEIATRSRSGKSSCKITGSSAYRFMYAKDEADARAKMKKKRLPVYGIREIEKPNRGEQVPNLIVNELPSNSSLISETKQHQVPGVTECITEPYQPTIRETLESLMATVWAGGQKSHEEGSISFEQSLEIDGSSTETDKMTVKDVIATIEEMINNSASNTQDDDTDDGVGLNPELFGGLVPVYSIRFIFKKDLDKSVMVQKKTKNRNSIHFIPRSIILGEERQKPEVKTGIFGTYSFVKIDLILPKWYCDRELGFYR